METLQTLFFFLLFIYVYFLPYIICKEESPNKKSVFVINLFLGWTFLGWVVALAMAVKKQEPMHQA